jgi:hypothetical protein
MSDLRATAERTKEIQLAQVVGEVFFQVAFILQIIT